MAQISEQSDLSKNLVFKRRVNHSKLSLFHPFHLCCLSHQSFLQSPTPFLENVHYLLHEDASIILFTFLNLSLIINSKLCSCLHSHQLFRGQTGGHGPASADGDRNFRSTSVSFPEMNQENFLTSLPGMLAHIVTVQITFSGIIQSNVCCLVAKSCLHDCSTPGFPSLSPGICSISRQLSWDVIHPSHPPSPPSPPAFNLSQHQGLFQ